jgi:hypothetical protein
MLNDTLKEKIKFIDDLSKVVAGRVSSIVGLEYLVLEEKDRGYNEEFVVVNYNGGAKQARCCTCNSTAAIFNEVAKMTYSSQVNPRDTEWFNKAIASGNYNIYSIKNI